MAPTTGLAEPQLAAIARKQLNVITRAQASVDGLTRRAIEHRVRPGGPWQRLLPGIYLAVTGTPTQAQYEIAALLFGGPGSVITGLTALRRHGMRVADGPAVAVLIPA